jgi:hypothetical protein
VLVQAVIAYRWTTGTRADSARRFPDRLSANTLAVVPPLHVALGHCAFADFLKGVPDDLAELARSPNLSLKVSTITLDLMAEHGDVADGVAELAAVFG